MEFAGKNITKHAPTLFLQGAIVAIGIGALAFILWEPQVEGVNAHATNFEIYFKDPFLAYVYLSSIAFFTALYQGFRLLGYARRDEVFSLKSVKALGTIKYCALTLAALVVPPLSYLIIVRPEEDIAGGVAMGIFIIGGSLVVAAVAQVWEKVINSKVIAN